MQYNLLQKQYEENFLLFQKQYKKLFYIILLLIGCISYSIVSYFKTNNILYIGITIIGIIVYLFFLKYQDKIKWRRNIAQQQLKVVTDEINFLAHNIEPFNDGEIYLIPNHPYSNDLDIFGKGSLYKYLNRATTYIGETTLATTLSTLLPNDVIYKRQEAIKELATKVTWRQKINAIGQLVKDNKATYQNILLWTNDLQPKLSISIKLIAILLIVTSWTCYSFLFINGTGFWFNIATFAFLLNNAFLGTQYKKIKKELIDAYNIEQILKNYGQILHELEQEKFENEYNKTLQEKLKFNQKKASTKIKELSSLFGSLNSVNNVFGAFILNGLFLSHIYILNKLLLWKIEHAKLLQTWLETIGKLEALNSLANYSYNNPNNVFPSLNTESEISFSNLGHPLIRAERRVTNDISFAKNNFIILSGSNMSGKSTFLRTVGINIVLAGTGAPVCATKASLHLLPVYASMRLADSLVENESYFFAEIKRLQLIKEVLDQKKCFVLLDEILRGTNSDDKQNGTIQFIKKMVEREAVGIIATHDLEVCETTNNYPQQLNNKCFEVEIVNNDLQFDFKLRDGICKNKSATFLMEKLRII